MAIRRRALPRGWYPDEPESLSRLVLSWAETPGVPAEGRPGPAIAAVAPHAGWSFSGRIAARSVAALGSGRSVAALESGRSVAALGSGRPGATLAIFGGHLPAGAPALAAPESGFDTPLGPLEADRELLSALDSTLRSSQAESLRLGLGVDEEPDNTVEVLLPLVAVLLPGVKLLWLRAPNDISAIELGAALQKAGAALGREVLCLGSTDLTHYGPNYGFSPKGHGPAAEEWVRGTNDRRFIEALLDLDGPRAVSLGESERSACSSGAAAAALGFALASGASQARLLEYATSLELRPDESFVGYASVAFYR